MVGKTYGFYLQRGMGYGLLQTYGLWYAIPCEPSWWTAQAMGYKGLWVIGGMCYEGFDCTSLNLKVSHVVFDTLDSEVQHLPAQIGRGVVCTQFM